MIKLKEASGFRYAHSILPIGILNIKTGSSKYFNIYIEWPTSTCEVWKDTTGKYRFIFTSGKASTKTSREDFKHDQTDRYLFTANMVDFCPVSEMAEDLSQYGRTVLAYTYK